MQPYQTKTVYDSKTGEAITLHGVDARERLACGLATEFPMVAIECNADGSTSPEITGDGTGEAIPPIDSQKPKRGRKPKGE